MPYVLTGAFLAAIAISVSTYLLFGHHLLTAVHSGKAFILLGRLAGNRALPLEQYLHKADLSMFRGAVTVFLSFFFYLFLFLVVRHLLRSDADSAYGNPSRASRVRASEVAGAFLIYSLLTIAFFYPVIPHIPSELIGPPEDNMASYWTVWWARLAIQGNLDFFRTPYVFYPEGSSLLFHTNSLYNLAAAVTVGRPLSPVAVYNLLVLQTFLLSGVGAFLLARHLTGDTAAALVGGFIFAFSPSHVAHSFHHLNIASVQFIPFFVLYYLKTMEDGSKRNVAWAGVFFFLNTLCDWTYAVYALFFMAACYGITACHKKKLLLSGQLVSSLVITGATFLVLSPLIVGMLAHASRAPNIWVSGHERLAVDLAGLFVPHYQQTSGIPLLARMNRSYTGVPWESVGYLGLFSVGLMLASSRVLVARGARYVLGLLFSVILSLGTSLHLMGRAVPIYLPSALIRYVPVLSGARAPGRMMAYAYLLLGVLVAIAFSYQLREGFLRKRRFVVALLVLGIVADFWSPCRETTAVRLPTAYTSILGREKILDFGILDLPSSHYYFAATYMMYQTLHGIPIVQGYLARTSPCTLRDTLAFDDLQAQQKQLCAARVKYIVVHKGFLARETGEAKELDLDRYAGEYGVYYEDEENLVLRVY